MSDEYQIEMLWVCSACQKQNLGRHMICQGCGDPKEEREAYVMPGEIGRAAEISDPKLLRMAHAGENWKCAYCSSDQRNLDGSCARCGAGKALSNEHPKAPVVAYPVSGMRGKPVHGRPLRLALIVVGCVVLLLFGLGFGFFVRAVAKPHTAQVRSATWARTLRVERRELVARKAFTDAIPGDAIEIADAGVGVHHYDKVFDHYETERYTVTVPDGTRSESYSVQESCGQTCTTSPRSCSKSCTTNKNGFATCRDVCTGGNQSCSTKYCSVTKTRQVPKTREESRTRQVERFRQEPRYASQATFRSFAWVTVFDGKKEGAASDPPTWPETNVAPLPDGGVAETREQKSETFKVTLVDNYGGELVHQPKDAAELERFAIGKTFLVGRDPAGYATFSEMPAK